MKTTKITAVLFYLICCISFHLYAQPAISSFSPQSGVTGTHVTINGSGFDADAQSNTVFFGTVKASILSATTNEIIAIVPKGATFLPISVTANSLTAYATNPFIVTFPGINSSFVSADFITKLTAATGQNPKGVFAADLDDDGKADLIIANSNSNTISIFKNTSVKDTISFNAKADIITGDSPQEIFVADIDGDNKQDIVCTNYNDNTVSVMRNTGSLNVLSFAAKIDFITGKNPLGISISDINNDGRPDIIVANDSAGSVSVIQNISSVGSVSFETKKNFEVGINPKNLFCVDLNSDGKVDIEVTNYGSGSISVLKNTSTVDSISFGTKEDFITGKGASGIFSGDLDKDNKPDIVVANDSANTISILHNSSTNDSVFFDTVITYPTSANPVDVYLSDLNGDSNPEIVALSKSVNSVAVFENKSTLGSVLMVNSVSYSTGANPYAVWSSDLDSDDKPDMVVTNSDDNTITILRNQVNEPLIFSFNPTKAGIGMKVVISGSNFTGTNAVSFGGTAAASFTVDSASVITAIVGSGASGDVEVVTPYGKASIAGFTFVPPPLISSFDPVICGEDSIVTIKGLNFANATLISFGGTSAKSFNIVSDSVITAKVGTGATGKIAVVTLYGEDSLDGFTFVPPPVMDDFQTTFGSPGTAITITGSNFTWAHHVNFGDSPALSFSILSPTKISAVVGTAGASGKVSVTTLGGKTSKDGFTFIPLPVITQLSPSSGNIGSAVIIKGKNFNTITAGVTVYFGAVKASVTKISDSSITVTVPIGATYAPVSVTVNNLTASSDKYFDVTFASDGIISASTFSAPLEFNTVYSPYGITTGDFDGDGKPDIVASGPNSSASVLRNISSPGSVTFEPNKDFTIGAGSLFVTNADLDGDGRSDLIFVNEYAHSISILKNESTAGSISFASKTDYATGGPAEGVVVADFDGDAKPDVAIVNYYPANTIAVFRNISSGGVIAFEAAKYFLTSGSSRGIAVADINGDLKPDMLVVNAIANTASVFINNGGIGLISFQTKDDSKTGQNPWGVCGVDFDGDGKPDIGTANASDNNVSILRNKTAGGIVSIGKKTDFSVGYGPIKIIASDFDGDNKPDIVTADRNNNAVSVLKNTSVNNNIAFDPHVDYNAGTQPYSICVADFDGDGKPDIANTVYPSGSGHTVAVLRNLVNVTLPLTLLNFSAQDQGGKVLLTWKTTNEHQVNNFVIEYSLDGSTFSSVGAVKATNIAGMVNQYSFVHSATKGGNNFYRLKMVDADGKYTYSKTMLIQISNSDKKIFAHPNPVTNTLIVEGLDAVNRSNISVINSNGATILSQSVINSNHSLNVKMLAAGVYFLKIKSKDAVTVLQFVKQ